MAEPVRQNFDIDWNDLDKSAIGLESPPIFRSSSSVGENGTSGVLGFDHNILQLSSYKEKKVLLVQGYFPDRERDPLRVSRQLLFRCQNEGDETSYAWGLYLNKPGPKEVDSGYIDYKWPTRKSKAADSTLQKTTTYVSGGKLYQVMAVAALAQCTIDWRLGGNIQLLQNFVEEELEELGTSYSVQSFGEGNRILTIGCDLGFSLDVELFIDWRPQSLTPERSQDQAEEYVAATCRGSIQLEGTIPKVLVAVFTLRDNTQTKSPEPSVCPDWTDLQDRLGLSKTEFSCPLISTLEENARLAELPGIPHIIHRHVERLLSVAAVPDLDRADHDPPRFWIFNKLVGPDAFAVNFETSFWHIRFLTKVLNVLQPFRQNDHNSEVYHHRISKVVSGAIRKLFERTFFPCGPEVQSFRTLALYYAMPHLPGSQITELQLAREFISPRPVPRGRTREYDHVTCLLQWCHRMILQKPDFVEKLRMEFDFNPEDIQRSAAGALEKPSLRTIPTEIETLRGDGSPEDINDQEAREELWNQLALLQVELFRDDSKIPDIITNFVDEVAKRLKAKETRSLGNSPPWGYRCLDHSLPIELAIAYHNLNSPRGSLLETVQAAYAECSYFLQSNHSFLKSWDSTDSAWFSEHWDCDSSSQVNSSFLTILTLDLSTLMVNRADRPAPVRLLSVETRLEDILEVIRDISHPQRKHVKFPWKGNLTVGRPYYPRFMCDCVQSRDLSLDQKKMNERMERLERENRSNSLVTKVFPGKEYQFPEHWSPDSPIIPADQICVTDLPSEANAEPQSLISRLTENRIVANASCRIIMVAQLPRDRLLTYLRFAHPDAWDTIVDYFGPSPAFRGYNERHDEHEQGEITWHTSITIPHVILALDADVDVVKDRFEIPREFHTGSSGRKAFLDVCISIGMTGDMFGEFWTSSIIGCIQSCQTRGRTTSSSQQDTTDKVKKVMERFRYDKLAARNLVFALHLTEVCHIVSERCEDVLEKLRNIVNLEESEGLYRVIASADLFKAEAVATVTLALRRVLWGIERLETLDKSMKTALSLIDEAKRHVNLSLSKRRMYWHEKLEEFEEEHVWEGFEHSRARLASCQSRVEALANNAIGVKDNLIFLSNMSSTQAILTTTADTSNMRIIAILTALFLPFTFVAVFLTIPMFEWPKPPDGQVIYKIPFITYFAASAGLTVILGFVMWYISKDKYDRSPGLLQGINASPESNHPPSSSQSQKSSTTAINPGGQQPTGEASGSQRFWKSICRRIGGKDRQTENKQETPPKEEV